MAEAIPPVATRLRRDFTTLITLIGAHALLHQLHRERDSDGAVVANFEDYATVRTLVSDLLADAVEHAVSATVRETVAAVQWLTGDHDPLDQGVPVTRVATRLRIDKSTAHRRVRVAIARGFIRNLEERRGHTARLVLGEPLPDDAVLLPVTAELERLHGCTADGDDSSFDGEYPRLADSSDTPERGAPTDPLAGGPVVVSGAR